MNALVPTATKTISFRPMDRSDLEQVLAIDRQSFSMPWPASAYEYELFENPASLLWVAEEHQAEDRRQVVGMVVVWLIVDEAHIATIAVHPDFRGRGISKGLMVTALKEIIQRGFKTATLEVRANNLIAQGLYRGFGFRTVGVRPHYYRDNHEDALIMTVYNLDQSYLEWVEKNIGRSLSGASNEA